MKTMYVNQLNNETQEAIRQELHTNLIDILTGNELTEAINDAMDSRLSDLEDTININQYV
ncbi:hypothetical protein [Halobacillus litoralis]|uniref:hypothetical protein n=1 Tax=Halobacillus litoralis TaxID=45668 RepID=UPI001CD1A3AC|nr:hypothetical protein [Halobacillus litoralis]MCA1021613.1 hypothetical protein [Halobacillus litoralis]